MVKLRTALVSAVAIASAAVLASPGVASADSTAACAGGKICLFDGHNLTGDVLQLEYGVDNPNIGYAWNDRASSVWNRADNFVCIYTDANYRGYHFTVPPGEKQELLFGFDNAVTSLEYGGCGAP
ncbi:MULTISPECIES: peptidase inhibitor family I36 protein [Streptomyces]|uniref:peptidase inhibitor family I36 protein n=1 Tax=Streptomyces TaxID=1883 RepID=UPI002FDC3C52